MKHNKTILLLLFAGILHFSVNANENFTSLTFGIGSYKPKDLKNAYTGTLGSLKLKTTLSNKYYVFTQALWTESYYFEDELTNRPDLYIRKNHNFYPNANSVANTLMVGGGFGFRIYEKERLKTFAELGALLHQRSKKYPYGLDKLIIYREENFHTLAIPVNLGASLNILKNKKLIVGFEYNGIITQKLNHGLQFNLGWQLK